MPAPAKSTVRALLEQSGRTYAAQAGVQLRNAPSPLFRLLTLSILLSARISSDIAVAAARDLSRNGWRTPAKLAQATWAERTKVLNRAGYARYDERTSRMLGETAELLMDRYRGDLRQLREEAGHDPAQERRLLKAFKGMGDVGVDIFFREVQQLWNELFPFADRRVLQAARRLGLPGTADELANQVARRDFVRLVAALVRVDLEHAHDEIRARSDRRA